MQSTDMQLDSQVPKSLLALSQRRSTNSTSQRPKGATMKASALPMPAIRNFWMLPPLLSMGRLPLRTRAT